MVCCCGRVVSFPWFRSASDGGRVAGCSAVWLRCKSLRGADPLFLRFSKSAPTQKPSSVSSSLQRGVHHGDWVWLGYQACHRPRRRHAVRGEEVPSSENHRGSRSPLPPPKRDYNRPSNDFNYPRGRGEERRLGSSEHEERRWGV